MSNKLYVRSNYRNRNPSNYSQFQLNLTRSQDLAVTSLLYSHTPTLIDIANIQPPPQLNIQPFLEHSQLSKHNCCSHKNCFDRNFEKIRVMSKSSANVKLMSPNKINITLRQQSEEKKKLYCIHSAKNFHKKEFKEKDLLKEFKELEEIRRELKSRNSQNPNRLNLSLNVTRNKTAIQKQKQKEKEERQLNPQKANVYLELKTRISKRYNNMFKKLMQGVKDEYRHQDIVLKDICSAHSIGRKKINSPLQK